jgi:uncharacterized protein (TIGR02246 family)
MKRLALVAILLTACGSTQMASNDAENAIKQNNAAFMTAMRAGDMDAVVNSYTADAVLMPPNMAAAHGPAGIRATWTGFVSPFSSVGLTLTPEDVQQSGDLAVETGRYTVNLVPKGTTTGMSDNGKYVVVWKKADGKWRMYRDIFNSDLPAPH